MNRIRSVALCLVPAAFGCTSFVDGVDPVADEQVEVAEQKLVANDLYDQLRALEYALPPKPASETIAMGSWSPGGSFAGLGSTCSIVFVPFKHKECLPATKTIGAIRAVLNFTVPAGVTLTANGRSATSDYSGKVVLDVGDASFVEWTLQSGSYSYSDKLNILRPEVSGMGAFTIAALPFTIVYDPVQNQGHSNTASTSFATESTVVDTITTGTSTTNAPQWAEGQVAKQLGIKLAKKFPQTALAYQVLQGIISAWGSVDTTVTSDSQVNTDKTLSVKVAQTQSITATSHAGPGHGDTFAFYKDVRVAWGMDEGRVTLTPIDHGAFVIVTVDSLKSDLAAVNSGGVAPVTGLDADTLKALIQLDPMAATSKVINVGSVFGGGVTLPTARFTKDLTITVNGASYSQTVSHNITQSDKVSKLSTTTTVTDYHPGWLTLLGLGQNQAGKVTTKISFGASRTVTTSETKSATLTLQAAPSESYTVEVNYDNIFGTFLARTPPAPPLVLTLATATAISVR